MRAVNISPGKNRLEKSRREKGDVGGVMGVEGRNNAAMNSIPGRVVAEAVLANAQAGVALSFRWVLVDWDCCCRDWNSSRV